MNHDASLLLFALFALIALVFLIARWKLHPFIAMTLVSVVIGFHSGLKLPDIAKTYEEGLGHTLGFLGVVVGLGMMLGKMLTESGGAHVIAQTLVRRLGRERLPWAMLLVALIVGVPVLFGVGLLLLVPLVFAVARETNTPHLRLAFPVVAGLSVAQGFLPPHPGPMMAIAQIGADPGKTILFGALVGLPTAIITGPVWGNIIGPRLQTSTSELAAAMTEHVRPSNPPGFALTVFTVLLPVLLMLLASFADLILPLESRLREWADFLGSPIIAMLLAVLFSIYSFGYARGFSRGQILQFFEVCLAPGAGILLVVGAGGGLSKVLEHGGVGEAIADVVQHANVSPLLLGWLVAASIRVAVGSATVAIATASALMAPVVVSVPGVNRELLVLAMGAGSLFLSHVNDGGFWLVKESFGLSVPQTLKSWTVLETGIGLIVLALVMLLAQIV